MGGWKGLSNIQNPAKASVSGFTIEKVKPARLDVASLMSQESCPVTIVLERRDTGRILNRRAEKKLTDFGFSYELSGIVSPNCT